MKGPYDDLDDKILITELALKPPRGSALYNIETPKQTKKRLQTETLSPKRSKAKINLNL
jgi:hypothetical protein